MPAYVIVLLAEGRLKRGLCQSTSPGPQKEDLYLSLFNLTTVLVVVNWNAFLI